MKSAFLIAACVATASGLTNCAHQGDNAFSEEDYAIMRAARLDYAKTYLELGKPVDRLKEMFKGDALEQNVATLIKSHQDNKAKAAVKS